MSSRARKNIIPVLHCIFKFHMKFKISRIIIFPNSDFECSVALELFNISEINKGRRSIESY